jgi:ubiquitin-like protein Pup
MSEKVQIKKSAPKKSEQVEEVAPKDQQVDHAELDALLDEIDGLLEENAEQFVKGYIQKGGE